jgi:uncharacterized protein (DUF2235 family)
MTQSNLPVRLIICVDGTWCTPDGPYGNTRNHNNSNVFRIYSSIKEGVCKDSQGQSFIQRREYIQGIGSKDYLSWLARYKAGIYGRECFKQIRDAYKLCCELPSHDKNEVWLYGFSRGAFVVRAVAGLLHQLGVLRSTHSPRFEEDFQTALRRYKDIQAGPETGLRNDSGQ